MIVRTHLLWQKSLQTYRVTPKFTQMLLSKPQLNYNSAWLPLENQAVCTHFKKGWRNLKGHKNTSNWILCLQQEELELDKTLKNDLREQLQLLLASEIPGTALCLQGQGR